MSVEKIYRPWTRYDVPADDDGNIEAIVRIDLNDVIESDGFDKFFASLGYALVEDGDVVVDEYKAVGAEDDGTLLVHVKAQLKR